MQDSFANYMKKEVIRYIKEELNKGISISDIRKALLRGGHHKGLIEEAIYALQKENFNLERAMREPVKSKTLAEELYAEVLSSIIDYIQFQKKQGYTAKEIKSVLLRHGHSEHIINQAIAAVETDSNSKTNFRALKFIICLVGFVVFLLWVGASTKDDFSKILSGFFPALASLLVIGLMENKLNYRQQTFLWFVPFVFSGVFFILGGSKSYPIFEGMKIFNLAVLSLIISMIFAIILIGQSKEEQQPEPITAKGKKKKVEEEKEEIGTAVEQRPKIREIRPA